MTATMIIDITDRLPVFTPAPPRRPPKRVAWELDISAEIERYRQLAAVARETLTIGQDAARLHAQNIATLERLTGAKAPYDDGAARRRADALTESLAEEYEAIALDLERRAAASEVRRLS